MLERSFFLDLNSVALQRIFLNIIHNLFNRCDTKAA